MPNEKLNLASTQEGDIVRKLQDAALKGFTVPAAGAYHQGRINEVDPNAAQINVQAPLLHQALDELTFAVQRLHDNEKYIKTKIFAICDYSEPSDGDLEPYPVLPPPYPSFVSGLQSLTNELHQINDRQIKIMEYLNRLI